MKVKVKNEGRKMRIESENLKSRWLKIFIFTHINKIQLYFLGGEKNNYKCRDSKTA